MRYIILLVCIISSCSPGESEIRYMRDKIQALEKKVDSLSYLAECCRNQGMPVMQEWGATGVQNDSKKKIKKSPYTARCQAITKKGTQCSRNARSGGYCWQHGG